MKQVPSDIAGSRPVFLVCFLSAVRFLEMEVKPARGKHRYFIERAGLFEQVGSAWNDGKPLFAVHQIVGVLIQFNDAVVFASDNKQGGRTYGSQSLGPCKIRPSAA